MTPSNANTSGLEVVQWEYRTAPHRQWHITDSKAVADQEAKDGSEVLPRLVRAASAQARIAELETRNADASMLAYRWMEAHDRLKAGLDYDLPSPADLPAAEARADRLAKGLKDAEESARRYASCYEPSSDGRNTFLMLADHIHALQQEG